MEEDDQISKVLDQWNKLLENVGHLATNAEDLREQVGYDVDMLEGQMLMIESRVGEDLSIGNTPFASVWDGLAFINDVAFHMQRFKVEQDTVKELEKQMTVDRAT